MEHVSAAIGPLGTNTHLLADPATRRAIVIDAAIPGARWVAGEVARRGWRLVLIVSTHGHWDHTGDNAALQDWTKAEPPPAEPNAGDGAIALELPDRDPHPLDGHGGALIAAHRDDWHRLTHPQPLFAPFPIPPCVPALDLAEGGAIRIGRSRLEILHTPGHTEGSVCLFDREAGLLFAGDTLFPGGWGRVDLPGGDPAAMAASLARLARLPDAVRVLPGHGAPTTIGTERPLLEMVVSAGRLPVW